MHLLVFLIDNGVSYYHWCWDIGPNPMFLIPMTELIRLQSCGEEENDSEKLRRNVTCQWQYNTSLIRWLTTFINAQKYVDVRKENLIKEHFTIAAITDRHWLEFNQTTENSVKIVSAASWVHITIFLQLPLSRRSTQSRSEVYHGMTFILSRRDVTLLK